MKLSLDRKSAEEIRKFARELDNARIAIDNATHNLQSVYNRNKGELRLGVRAQDFEDLFTDLYKARTESNTSIIQLKTKLFEVANKIDEYVSSKL